MKDLKHYILVLETIIPEKLCDDILKEYKNCNEWLDTTVGGKSSINKKIRNCTTIEISLNEIIEKNKNVRKKIDDDIFTCAKNAIEIYNKEFSEANITKDTGYNLLKYEKGCFYNEHIDSFISVPRTISCSFILNDNFGNFYNKPK